ncbi:WD40 repeat domain-containing protein, partial [Streptomyces sp. 351MFTsu5.1]|uniref:WD40 repeat domain-containing protein n=1 Tax=Streptomyces sp. 351MFTsu5.1 TaxID=1172180 RepID=UPI001F2C1569
MDELSAYAQATLQLTGQERDDSPYRDAGIAAPVAQRIAELAAGNFLLAALVARLHGLYDETPVDRADIYFPDAVYPVLEASLSHLKGVRGITSEQLLLPLAYAEAPGLTLDLWRAGLRALLGRTVRNTELAAFANTSAANFLIESGTSGEDRVYRLFHQALNDTLTQERAATVVAKSDEDALLNEFSRLGHEQGWSRTVEYLRRSLPSHADRADRIDTLLRDDEYLLYSDLRRLVAVAGRATTQDGVLRSRLLRLTPKAWDADAAERGSLFSVREALEDLGSTFMNWPSVLPYKAKWSATPTPTPEDFESGHTGWVRAVCSLPLDGRQVVASTGADSTVRLWDPADGRLLRILQGHTGLVNAVCAVPSADRLILASAGTDGTIRLWNPSDGQSLGVLQGHAGVVNGLCAVAMEDRNLIASAGSDGIIRLWDPSTRQPTSFLNGHLDWINDVCVLQVDGRSTLASASDDGTVRVWDLASSREKFVLEGHAGWVRSVCAMTIEGRQVVVSGGSDGTVRLWDPSTAELIRVSHDIGGPGGVRSLADLNMHGNEVVAAAGANGEIHLLRLDDCIKFKVLAGLGDAVNSICFLDAQSQTALVAGSADGWVRLWDPVGGTKIREMAGHPPRVQTVSAVGFEGREVVVSGGADGTVRLWNPTDG